VRVTAAGVCCVVAALSYSGAVTLVALFAFVLPGIVVVTVVTAGAARLSLPIAVGFGLVTALGVAEVVNLVSGTGYGPAARSTFAAAAFTALAVSAVLSPAPALFTAAVVGVVIGALGLGAGAEVAPVAVATAVVTVVALALVEAQGRHWTRRRPRLLAVLVLALLVGGVVATVALQADRRLDGDPAVFAPGAVQPTIRPPRLLENPNPRPTPTTAATPTPPVTPTVGADGSAPAGSSKSALPLRTIWLVVLMAVLALLLGVGLRILWVALGWRRLRRRLRRGSETEKVTGAWVWSTRRLRAAGWPLPASLSVDAVAAGQGTAELPRVVRSALRQVALSAVDVVYAPPPGVHDPKTAWAAADEVGRVAVSAMRPARRLFFAIRPINSRSSRSAASPSATPEEIRA
jgi:hypothetical protein